jgi:hypothetical protein
MKIANEYETQCNLLVVLASSLLTTTIYWPCYCADHVYVVIQFCDSIWGFF